ncbi:hypothetical protein IKF67_00940 [Candidatus Saccharibacteria bacterium]|nr:hypothetical protein [Candidatus Saccharibacteria bacterium]
MADAETEAEWAKSKRIEAEKAKAAKALAESKPDKSNLAFLDAPDTKVKGWSSDSNVILAHAEKMGNRSIILAVCGVVLSIIGYVGGIVSATANLGLASIIISGIPSGIGFICMGLAVLMAIITIAGEITNKVRKGRKFSSTFWSALSAIIVVVLYWLVWSIISFA